MLRKVRPPPMNPLPRPKTAGEAARLRQKCTDFALPRQQRSENCPVGGGGYLSRPLSPVLAGIRNRLAGGNAFFRTQKATNGIIRSWLLI